MAIITIPTRTSSNLNAASDINDLMTNVQTLIDEYIAPIGTTFVQVPTTGANGKSNTKTTAFPTAEEPGTLYGGTWTQLFEDEGVFFRTEGDPYSEGETHLRTDGKQSDTGQGHWHAPLAGCRSDWWDVEGGVDVNTGGHPASISSVAAYDLIADTVNGDPRTGKENRPINRLFKIWKRTA